MIYQYDIVRDSNLKPTLFTIKEIEHDNTIDYVDDVINMLNRTYSLSNCVAEHNYIIGYSEMNSILGIYCVSVGDYQSCNIYNREIALFLTLTGSVSFELYHNHPNNILSPSDEDFGVAASLEVLGNVLGISFKGSYIIGKSGWKNINDEHYVYNEYLKS